MQFLELMDRVRRMAGDVDKVQFSDLELYNWIESGVYECAINNNLLQKTATVPTVIGSENYPLPLDILKLHSVKYNGIKLNVLTLQEFDELYPNPQVINSTPDVCYVWAGVIKLYPKPDAVKNLTIDYIYKPSMPEIGDLGGEDLPLPVGYDQRILDYCLAQVAQQDDDLNRYQLKMQEFQTGVQALKDQPEWEYDLYPFMSVDDRDTDGQY